MRRGHLGGRKPLRNQRGCCLMSQAVAQQIPALKEVETALVGASGDKRMKMMLALTDLFMLGQESFSTEQVGIFDALLINVIRQIEQRALVELSVRLAPQAKAPPKTLRTLAAHDSIGIAGPI